jgi:hypothetical protein
MDANEDCSLAIITTAITFAILERFEMLSSGFTPPLSGTLLQKMWKDFSLVSK